MFERSMYVEKIKYWVSKLSLGKSTKALPVIVDKEYNYEEWGDCPPNLQNIPGSKLIDSSPSSLNIDTRLNQHFADSKSAEFLDFMSKSNRKMITRVGSHGLEIIVGTAVGIGAAVSVGVAIHKARRDRTQEKSTFRK